MRRLPMGFVCAALCGYAWAADERITPMVTIAAGAFNMGRNDGPEDERPAHQVTLPTFQIDRLPVTNVQFAGFLNARGHSTAQGDRLYDYDDNDARIHQIAGKYVADRGFETHPAVEPSWLRASIARGVASVCPPKPNGRKPRAAPMRACTRGETPRPTAHVRNLPHTLTTLRRLKISPQARARTAYSAWRAMRGNGWLVRIAPTPIALTMAAKI